VRILLIEDESKTAAYLTKGLREAGFVVEVAADGETGLDLATVSDFDLIVCDVMLPRLDGWSVVRGIRAAGKEVPIIFLTARDGVEDRVKGLDLGGDDYLVKPFAFSELLARIRSHLRRGQSRQGESFRLGDLVIDPIRRKTLRGTTEIGLTPKEFSLLWLLVRRQGEVLTRTIIAEQVWDMHFDSDTNVVDVAIRRLRQKVDDPFPLKLIHTVRGVGYVAREE
jgi:two-component system copper resistance phosphate regulon response regulator CusR